MKFRINVNFWILLASLVISVIIWFIISISVYPTAPRMLNGVKLAAINLDGTVAGENLLSVISPVIDSVNVQIQGDRTQVGTIKPEQLTAKVSIDNVIRPGEYNLNISVENHSGVKFEVLKVIPDTIAVDFDQIGEKLFDVVADISNVKLSKENSAEGMFIDQPTITPSTVTIKGPLHQISEINSCVAKIQVDGSDYSESQTIYTSELTLYGTDGSVISQNSLTIPPTEYTVNIPILVKKTFPFEYGFRNAPEYLNTELLKSHFELSYNEITVAAPKDSIDSFSPNLGYIDLRDLSLNYSRTFNLNLPGNFKNMSGITSVTATFDSETYDRKEFTIKAEDFSIIGGNSWYKITPDTKEITFSIIGPRTSLDKILNVDIIVEIDLSGELYNNSTLQKPVKIIIENFPNCLALNPDISVTLNATPIEITESWRSS